ITGRMDGPTHCGLDYFDNGDAVTLSSVAQYGGTSGVACDDEHLHALVDEMIHHIEGIRSHFGDRTRSVGAPSGVTHVQQRFVGKQVKHRPCDCETTHTAVKDADGCVCHSARVTE